MSASGSSALYAEYRAQRRLSESCDGVLPIFLESVGKPYRRSGLSLSRRVGVMAVTRINLPSGSSFYLLRRE